MDSFKVNGGPQIGHFITANWAVFVRAQCVSHLYHKVFQRFNIREKPSLFHKSVWQHVANFGGWFWDVRLLCKKKCLAWKWSWTTVSGLVFCGIVSVIGGKMSHVVSNTAMLSCRIKRFLWSIHSYSCPCVHNCCWRNELFSYYTLHSPSLAPSTDRVPYIKCHPEPITFELEVAYKTVPPSSLHRCRLNDHEQLLPLPYTLIRGLYSGVTPNGDGVLWVQFEEVPMSIWTQLRLKTPADHSSQFLYSSFTPRWNITFIKQNILMLTVCQRGVILEAGKTFTDAGSGMDDYKPSSHVKRAFLLL